MSIMKENRGGGGGVGGDNASGEQFEDCIVDFEANPFTGRNALAGGANGD